MSLRTLLRRVLSVRTELRLKRRLYRLLPLRHRAGADNVYHCCVHKTASQWIRAVMSDPLVYRHSGLLPYNYQVEREGGEGRAITERTFSVPFPERTVVTPLYLDFDNFAAVRKPSRYKAFFIQRDPRDLLVSWYFSTRYSHPIRHGRLVGAREALQQASVEEGMVRCVDDLERLGLFVALRSWINASRRDANVLVVRYEDLVGPTAESAWNRLFLHCDIPLAPGAIRKLLARYSFRRLSGGRAQGDEDQLSKYRKGVAGDWVNYFTPPVRNHFVAVTGDLVEALGYPAAAVAEKPS